MRGFSFGYLLVALVVGCSAARPTTSPTASAGIPGAGGNPLPAASPPLPPSDGWTVKTEINQLDGAQKVILRKKNFVARCTPKAVAYVLPPLPGLGHMLDTDTSYTQRVRYRKDGGPVVSDRWTVSDSYDSLFLPTGTLRKVWDGNKLTYEYKPEYQTAQTDTIDISGLAEEMTKAGCKL